MNSEHEKALSRIERLIDDATGLSEMTQTEALVFLEALSASVEASIDGLRDEIINSEED